MQENWLEIADAFNGGEAYVLAIIVNTEGATYRKAGTMMLINEQQECTGLLSGGCLEADIALHASGLFHQTHSKLIRYDLTLDADLLWGLGLGCEGKIDILLLPLNEGNNYLGFNQLLSHVNQHKSGRYWLKLPEIFEADTIQLAVAQYRSDITLANFDEPGKWLSIPISPPFAIGIVGAGPDAVPVANMAVEMGWKVTLFDHRENALNRSEFSTQVNKVRTSAEKATTALFEEFDAVVVMTHNLSFDQQYLAKLVQSSVPYLGLLGPKARRDKMLTTIGVDDQQVLRRVFGPVGLNLGGRSPQAIALSIVAEIQQQMALVLEKNQLQVASLYES